MKNPRVTFFAKTVSIAIFLTWSSLACTSASDSSGGSEVTPPKDGSKSDPANPDGKDAPPLAVATVASLISVSDVMVREPSRFHKALCSDGNIYDLEFDGTRFSLRAEPLSVCVLLADTKGLKPIGFCGDSSCQAAPVNPCDGAEQKALGEGFAKDQVVQHCWNVGNYPPLSFQVLVSRVGQSCQAQSFVKNAEGFKLLNSIDGTFEARKGEGSGEQGCFFEAGTNSNVADSEWFSRGKRVAPVLAFQKEKELYALLRTSWSGSENYQLFRVDGEKPIEVESFAEAFKDPAPEPTLAPPPSEPTKSEPKAKGKSKKGKKGKKEASQREATPPPEEAAPPTEDKADVPSETPEQPSPEAVPEQGVNPLEGGE